MKLRAPRTLRAVPFNLILNLRGVDRRPAKRTRRALTVSTVNPALAPGRQVPGFHALRDCAVFFFVVLGHRLPGVRLPRPLAANSMPERRRSRRVWASGLLAARGDSAKDIRAHAPGYS